LKKRLKEICLEEGIEYCGIAPAGPFTELKDILNERISQGCYTGLEEKNLYKRTDPRLTMQNVKSIIVCLFPYYSGAYDNSITRNISVHAVGPDYHVVIKDKLNKIGDALKKEIPNFDFRSFTDNGPLVDRYLAYLAGLGFFGDNNCLINEKYGSFVFIGYIMNNYPFEPDKPSGRQCMHCGLCLEACPGRALIEGCSIDPKKCLSYITQKKGQLTETEIDALSRHSMIYGCDVCQNVCPMNKGVPDTPITEFSVDPVYFVEKSEIEGMTNSQFKKKYGGRTFSWRGKQILNRNLTIEAHKKQKQK
jgi:epoxyqueuosine reductase